VLGACGDDGGGNGGATDTRVADLGPLPSDPLEPAAIAAELAVAWCHHRETCEPIFQTYTPESRAQCEARLTVSQRQYLEALAPLVAAGRVGFSRAALDACLQAIATGTADCARGVDPLACLDYLQGRTPTGGACGASPECAPGSWCEVATLGGCGTCKAVAGVGQSCASNVCAHGLECFALGNTEKCAPVTADLGAACGTATTGLCRGRLQCAGTSTFTCVAPAGAGATCDPAGERADCNVHEGQVCDADDVCAPIEISAPGDTCGEQAPTHLCDSRSRCDTATRKCVALPIASEACSASIPCADGAYCGNDLVCHADVAQGGACATSSQCVAPLFCIGGSCQPLAFAASCP